MPRDLRSLNPTPLSESEQFQLRKLLDRTGQSLSQAQEKYDRDREQERKLRAQRDRLALEESRLAKRLAQLHVDIDTVSAKIFELAPHATAFRFVNERLQKLAHLVPSQSFFNTRSDSFDRDQIQLLAEIALAMYQDSTRPKGIKPLRDRMAGVNVAIGPGGPEGSSGSDDPRAALAQAIIAAGRKAREGK